MGRCLPQANRLRPVFPIQPPKYLTPELVEFVRQRLVSPISAITPQIQCFRLDIFKELLPFTLAYGAHRFMRYRNLKFAMLVVCLFGLEMSLVAHTTGHDASWKAPASAAAKKNPLAKDANAAKAGQSTSCVPVRPVTEKPGMLELLEPPT